VRNPAKAHDEPRRSSPAARVALYVIPAVVIAALAAFLLSRSPTAVPAAPQAGATLPAEFVRPLGNAPAAISTPGTEQRIGLEGQPPRFVAQGTGYFFEPVGWSLDEGELQFSIRGKPQWAQFDVHTGRLGGVPLEEDVGRHGGIEITVSDGTRSATLGPFSIDVMAAASGTAQLDWEMPTQTSDGSPMPQLIGYRIDYGQSPEALLQNLRIENPGVTSAVVDNLTPGRWYFRIVALDADGLESAPTTAVQKQVE
jgi:hypothetical protein